MPYRDYLQTPYWKAVAHQARRRAQFKCGLCGESAPLSVHHRTYENRGSEAEHLTDLIALCSGCHETFHAEREVVTYG